ncbi:MAG: hypothetical protein Q9174_006804, partial [Haloplaca sp. 1 TL-2023]
MDKETFVLVGLPVLLGLLCITLWIIPSSVITTELETKCLYGLGYLAVFLTWGMLIWDWILQPAIELYQLFARTRNRFADAVAKLHERYQESPYRERLEQTMHHLAKLIRIIARSVAAGQYLEEPPQPEEQDERRQDQDVPTVYVFPSQIQIQIDNPDLDGASMVVHGSSVNSQQCEGSDCPWNDSGVYAESENSSVELEKVECSTADETAPEHRTTLRDSPIQTDQQNCTGTIAVDQASGPQETYQAETAAAHSMNDGSQVQLGTVLDSETRESQLRGIRDQETSQAPSETDDADVAQSEKPAKLLREPNVIMELHSEHVAEQGSKETVEEEANEETGREMKKADKKGPSTTPKKQNIPSFPTPPHESSSRSPSPPSPLSKMSYK